MPLETVKADAALAGLDRYSAIVDARSEAEFALDHLPGAVNWPSLTDEERAAIGTEHRASPFAARKRGAALVARNIANHLESHVLELPREWSPLVYCWRGGQRSGSLALVLSNIGFRVTVLEGGYREFRRAVVSELGVLPQAFSWVVVCGTTGSGKSLLLRALAARGEQVLDLEALANHRGSVLGLAPGERQPSQKAFETAIWEALRRFDPAQPVFVESESKKVGDLRVPEAVVERIRGAECVWLEVPLDDRVRLLMREYDFFVRDAEAFRERLGALSALRGAETVERWRHEVDAGHLEAVVRDLLVLHYDPIYRQSMRRNFPGLEATPTGIDWDAEEATLSAVADRVASAARPLPRD